MYTISQMTPAHVPQIAALEAAEFSAPWDEASVRAELTNPLSLWLVAAEGERVLGYIGSQTAFEDADLLSLCVRPDARRRGVAAALLSALEAALPERGAERLLLEVRASNAPALALYKTAGFTSAGLRKNYYEKPREDAYILLKYLNR